VSVKAKLWLEPEGVVVTSTRILPRLTNVKVQVTVSPASSATAEGICRRCTTIR
jgi:hypothetical protein